MIKQGHLIDYKWERQLSNGAGAEKVFPRRWQILVGMGAMANKQETSWWQRRISEETRDGRGYVVSEI